MDEGRLNNNLCLRVRVKIPKGRLDKSSTPNWYDRIDKIEEVYPGHGNRITRYRISGREADKKYGRNDLQVIPDGEPKPMPREMQEEVKKRTRSYKEPEPEKRKTRSSTKDEDSESDVPTGSEYPGVMWNSRRNEWKAVNRRGESLGYYKDENEAAAKARPKNKKGLEPEVYEVEALLSRRKEKNRVYFEVKWKGFKETTWEPRTNLVEDVPNMVRDYER